MALPILDGNQSATTLSSILTSGEHIPAHTVVSLGTQAITDISGAVSGSVVSISNFPATQPVSIASVTIGNTVTIAGTVTANPTGTQTIAGTVQIDGAFNANGVTAFPSIPLWYDSNLDIFLTATTSTPFPISGTVTIGSALPAGTNRIGVVTIGAGTVTIGAGTAQIGSVTASISGTVPISISSVTVGNSVTIGSLPAISGTVTANVGQILVRDDGTGAVTSGYLPVGNSSWSGQSGAVVVMGGADDGAVPAHLTSIFGLTFPISGTVTANTFALQGTAVTTSNFTSTTASTLLAGYNATREVLTIFNEGAGNLHLCVGATCTTIAYQVRLSAGDYYEVPNHQTTITHSAVFATAGTARVTEVF